MRATGVAVRVVRTAADLLVWALAVLGVVTLGVWGATTLGLMKPLVVISGSMEPQIMTGDLLIDTPVPMEEVEVGDVLSLRNDVTDKLVTHRVIEVTEQADGSWHVRMQGDANDSPDGAVYVVTDDTALAPRWQLAGAGAALMRLTDPATAVPLLVAVAAIVALSLMRPGSGSRPDDGQTVSPSDGAQGGAAREMAVASAR